MKRTETRDAIVHLWLRNFWAAFAVLTGLKLASLGYSILSPATRGAHPFHSYVLKSLLVFGSDMLGAAIIALLIALICLPLISFGFERISLGISIVAQLLHGAIGSFSFFTMVATGGPLNKEAIDLAVSSAPDKGDIVGAALSGSINEYVTPSSVAILVAFSILGGALVLLSPRVYRRLTGLRMKGLAMIFALEIVAGVVVLPFLASGEIGGIRIYTYGLEKSPVVELVWSYLRTSTVDMSLVDDEWKFDFSGMDPLASDAPPLQGASPRPTNVVVVAMESIGAPYLEKEETPMPFFRQLQKMNGSANFASNYSTWSLTSKAFFSVFASELPYPTYKAESLVNPAIPTTTLSEVLHNKGYFTAFITGQDLAYDRQMRFFQHRKIDLFWDQRSMPGIEDRWMGDWGVDDRLSVKNTLQLIREHRERPFFIYYGMTAGHHPFMACKEHEQNPLPNRTDNYMRALGFVDDRLRDLYEGLDAQGLLEDTLIVIFSDHGDGHGRYGGRNTWQPVIKVPLLIHGPQLADSARETTLVTSHLDVAPTVLALLGMEVPCTMKGRDLTRSGEHRVAVFGGRPPKWQMGVTDENWKFIWEDESVERLFDLSKDPSEDNNLVELHPDRAEFYKAKIQKWRAFSTNLVHNYSDILRRSDCGEGE